MQSDKSQSEQLTMEMLDAWYYGRARAMYRAFATFMNTRSAEHGKRWQLTRESVQRASDARRRYLQKVAATG